MDHSARCRAMVAFCTQRARMEDENEAFWLAEAEAWTARLNHRLRLVSQKPDIKSFKLPKRADGPVPARAFISIDVHSTAERAWTRLPAKSDDAR